MVSSVDAAADRLDGARLTLVRVRIKICCITRVEDALAAAHAGADAIGLVLWPRSPRAIDLATARAIALALPSFVCAVGLFVDATEDEVRAACAEVPLAFLQFHGDETPEYCRVFGRPYLKAVPMKRDVDLLQSAVRYGDAAALLVDAHEPGGMPGGTGRTFEWARVPDGLPQRIVLSGGLTPGNVAEAVRSVNPWAVDVSTGVEALDASGRPRKGVKDPRRIAAFVREVENAAAKEHKSSPHPM